MRDAHEFFLIIDMAWQWIRDLHTEGWAEEGTGRTKNITKTLAWKIWAEVKRKRKFLSVPNLEKDTNKSSKYW